MNSSGNAEDNSNIKIRSFTNKDKRIISKFYYSLNPFEKKEKKTKALFPPKSVIKPILLVAEHNKKVVGFIWSHFIQYGFYRYAEISELFVKKEFRNKGIGKKLVKETLRRLKKLKPKIIEISSNRRNKIALKFYRKLGFQEERNTVIFSRYLR